MLLVIGTVTPTLKVADKIDEFIHIVSGLSSYHSGGSLAEICGGAAGVSKLVARRQLPTGENVDLLTGFGLHRP